MGRINIQKITTTEHHNRSLKTKDQEGRVKKE